MKHKNLYISLSFFILFLLGLTSPVFAQNIGGGVGIDTEIKDKNVPDGAVIVFREGGYFLSDKEYDPGAHGIVVLNPVVSIEELTNPPSLPVVTQGEVYVQVSTINGPIAKGNLLTTSKIKGVAQKATKDGMAIGTALQPYTERDVNKVGKILANLNIGFNSESVDLRSNLLEGLNIAIQSPFLTPGTAFRYGLAGLVVLLSIAVGIFFFGRVAARGVEALGRNPLASRSILFGISFNFVLSLITFAMGLAIAYLILIL